MLLISKFDISDIEQKISEYESKHQIILPNQYRDFLLNYNGGETPDTSIKMGKISADIIGFFGFDTEDSALDFHMFDSMGKITDFLQDGFLPIAITILGDYIVVGISEGNFGKISFLYHDQEKAYIGLTDDLLTFVAKCKSEKVGYIPSIEERMKMVEKSGRLSQITSQTIAGWQAEIDKYKNICQEKVVISKLIN